MRSEGLGGHILPIKDDIDGGTTFIGDCGTLVIEGVGGIDGGTKI